MKKQTLLTLGLLPLFAAGAKGAEPIVPVAGTYTYTQNFDTMFMPAAAGAALSAGATNWVDGSTVPNWWFHYASNAAATPTGVFAGTAFVYSGNDGSVAPVNNLTSAGAANSPNRFFATPSTTARSEQSGIVVFENTSALSVQLSGLKYKGRVLRTNGGADNQESIFPWYRTGDSQAALLTITQSNLTAAQALTRFPVAVADTPTAGYYLDGWTQIPSGIWTYRNAAGATAVDETVPTDAGVLTGIRVQPGKFIALRFSNINDAGQDALLGIDDLELTFSEVNASLAATVSNVVRTSGVNPTDPSDDVVTFDLLVAGSGAVSASGWKIEAPAPASIVSAGAYNLVKSYNVPIADFTGALHQITGNVVDQDDAGLSESITVTAPWCAITPSTTSLVYNDGGSPADSTDDTVSYEAQATGQFTGPTYAITGDQNVPSTPYGSAAPFTGLVAGSAQALTFTDSADPACTAALTLHTPGPIGTNDLNVAGTPLISLPFTGTRVWTIDRATRQSTQVSATQINHAILSEVINLSAVGGVRVSATLDAVTGEGGSTSGFEAADSFRMDVILDGGAPVSILGSADANGNGTLNGAVTNNLATYVELPDAGDAGVTATFNFSTVVLPAVNTLQIRIVGNSNSPGERFTLRDLKLEPAPAALVATAGAATLNNNGTVDPADDAISVPVTITPINLGASTGWNTASLPGANEGPDAGLYTAANPVLFTVPAASAPKDVTIQDGDDSTKQATFTLTAPAPTFTVAAATNIVRNDNGPGVGDDTVSFDTVVTGTNGGPEFAFGTAPVTPTLTGTSAIAAAPGNAVSFTMPASALGGTSYVRFWDASYPASAVNLAVAVPVPATAPTSYVLAQKNLGGAGLSDVVSINASLPAVAAWQNYVPLRALSMQFGALATLDSEVIDLTGVGAVNFTGRLRGFDTSTGFEDADTLTVNLIIDGVVATPVRTTDSADLDDPRNGLEGVEIVGGGGSIAAPAAKTTLLSATIPESANNVQLVISGINNSANEQMILDQLLFVETADSDSDGMPDDYELANGLNPNDATDRDTDLDGDGQSNFSEFMAGTGPNDSASTLKIIEITRTGNNAGLKWSSVAGKTYRIDASAGLLAPWQDLGTDFPATGTETTAGPVDLTLLGNPLPDKYFLRVRVK